jgi:hypothetical protein
LGIVQALYHKPVALAKLDTTAFSDAVTLGNDLLVELSISGETMCKLITLGRN